MANISKEKLETILANAPQGTSPAGIISALKKKGHSIEGYEGAKVTASSVGNFLGGLVYGFSAPGRTIQNLLSKGVDKTTGTKDFGRATKQSFERASKTDVDTGAGKAGQFVGEASTFIAPGGAASAITKGSGVLARAGAQAVAAGGQEVLNRGEVGKEAVMTGLAAGVFPIAGQALSGAAGLAKSIIKNTAAGISGKGTKVIDTILKNPQAAREGLEEIVSRADDASTIRRGVSNIARKASDEFAEALEGLPKRLGRQPKVINAGQATTIKVNGKTYSLSLKGLKSKLTSELRKFDVNVNPKKAALDFSEAPLDTNEMNRLREVLDVVNNWKDTTPLGFHKLSRKIANFRKPGDQSKELNAIIDSVSRNAHQYIAQRIPAAKKMLADYQQAQDVIEVFNKEFRTSGRFIGGTADRIDTERKISTLFSGEKDTGKQVLSEALPGGEDISAREAGRLLSEDITRSGASIGDLLRVAVNTVISPKLIGQLTIRTGLAEPQVRALLNQIQKAEPALRAALIQAISASFDEKAE